MDIETALEQVIEQYKDRKVATGEVRVDYLASDCLYQIKMLKDVIQYWQDKQKWIKVSEKKPKIGEYVYGCRHWKGNPSNFLVAQELVYQGDNKWIGFHDREYDDIVCWLYLPKPPEVFN